MTSMLNRLNNLSTIKIMLKDYSVNRKRFPIILYHRQKSCNAEQTIIIWISTFFLKKNCRSFLVIHLIFMHNRSLKCFCSYYCCYFLSCQFRCLRYINEYRNYLWKIISKNFYFLIILLFFRQLFNCPIEKFIPYILHSRNTFKCAPHQWWNGNAQNGKTGGARFKPRSRLLT